MKPEELSKYRQVASHVVSAWMGKDWKTLPWSWESLFNSLWECFPACGVNVVCSFLTQGLHSASIPGILALDLCPSDTNKILTGKGAFLGIFHLGAGLLPCVTRNLKGICGLAPHSHPSASRSLFQVGPTKMSSCSTRARSRSWPRSRATPRRSPASCSTHPRCARLFPHFQGASHLDIGTILWWNLPLGALGEPNSSRVNLPVLSCCRTWCSRLLPTPRSGSGPFPTPPASRWSVPTRAP